MNPSVHLRGFSLVELMVLMAILAVTGSLIVWFVRKYSETEKHVLVNYCEESVCRPTWADDCKCYRPARLVVLPNGDVLCACHNDGGAS